MIKIWTVEDYLSHGPHQRHIMYASDLTDQVKANAAETVKRVNALLEAAAKDKVYAGTDEITGTVFASGWRPPSVNERTKNAASKSTHITAEGCDLQDDRKTRALATWCIYNLSILANIGLWMEDPRWTPDWVHVQTRPPGSKRRVYIPSTAPPKTPPVKGQRV